MAVADGEKSVSSPSCAVAEPLERVVTDWLSVGDQYPLVIPVPVPVAVRPDADAPTENCFAPKFDEITAKPVTLNAVGEKPVTVM